MKKFLILFALIFLLVSCIGRKEESVSGPFTFPDTGLSLIVPVNWLKTTIPGNQYPVLFTEVQYGIKPNIQLEYFSQDIDKEEALEKYMDKKRRTYPDFTTIDRSTFSTKGSVLRGDKVTAKRMNNDNIPLIHFSYIFNRGRNVYILSATCAEPSAEEYEPTFDKAIESLEISQHAP